MSTVANGGDVKSSESSEMRVPNRIGMNRRDFLRFSAIAGGSAAFLAACTAVPSSTSTTTGGESAESAPAESATVEGGTMIWMGHQEVAALSPNDTGPTVQWMMIAQIHEPLLSLTIQNEVEPILAESYEISEDSLTYTFKLREGVTFHNGQPFTSADVKYTYEFYRDYPESALAGSLAPVESVETPDDYTAVVHLKEINADFLVDGAQIMIVPHEYHAEVGQETYTTAPIGTGPFKLLEWVAADYTLLEANDDYWRGRPKLDFIRQNVVPEPAVRAIALETGEAHATVWPLLVQDSVRLREEEGFASFSSPANSVRFFPLNNRLPQLAEKEVRQAMLKALDRRRIIDELWNGVGEIAASYYTPAGATYFNSNIPVVEYDPDGARAQLDAAGWVVGADGTREKDGVRLSFTCTTITGDQARRPIAELAQQMLAEVGVEMLLAEAPVASILEALPKGEMDSSIFNWTFGSAFAPDPYDTLHSQGSSNFNGYSNARVDELIEAGRTTVDVEERKAIYHELQEIVADEVPFLFLMFDEWIYITVPGVGGTPESPTMANSDQIFPDAFLWSLPQNG